MSRLEFVLADWHLSAGDPTWLGWGTTCLYAVAFFATMVAGRAAAARERVVWWLLAALLAALGINKELDFQTLVFDLGRRLSRIEGWYEERRAVQAAFSLALALGMLGAAWVGRRDLRAFARHNRTVIAGLSLLCMFVLFRAASADHLWRLGHDEYDDKSWSWVLEVSGLALVLHGALASLRRA